MRFDVHKKFTEKSHKICPQKTYYIIEVNLYKHVKKGVGGMKKIFWIVMAICMVLLTGCEKSAGNELVKLPENGAGR